MILRIGTKGFTLIEIMVAVCVLSLGLLMIYEALFSCLNAYSYSSTRLDARRWMDEKIWKTQDELKATGMLMLDECSGSFVDKNRNFNWQMSVNLIDRTADVYLYALTLKVYWKQAQRNISLSQVAYVQN